MYADDSWYTMMHWSTPDDDSELNIVISFTLKSFDFDELVNQHYNDLL